MAVSFFSVVYSKLIMHVVKRSICGCFFKGGGLEQSLQLSCKALSFLYEILPYLSMSTTYSSTSEVRNHYPEEDSCMSNNDVLGIN